MKIWRGERIRVESDDSHNHNLNGLPGAFWGMARKVLTPILMRTKAVLVLRYIPLRIHLRGELQTGELQASDLHGLNSRSLLQGAEGSQDGGGG